MILLSRLKLKAKTHPNFLNMFCSPRSHLRVEKTCNWELAIKKGSQDLYWVSLVQHIPVILFGSIEDADRLHQFQECRPMPSCPASWRGNSRSAICPVASNVAAQANVGF